MPFFHFLHFFLRWVLTAALLIVSSCCAFFFNGIIRAECLSQGAYLIRTQQIRALFCRLSENLVNCSTFGFNFGSSLPIVKTPTHNKDTGVPFVGIRKSRLAPTIFLWQACDWWKPLRGSSPLYLSVIASWCNKANSGGSRQNPAARACSWQLEAWNITHASLNLKDIKWGMFLIYI